MPASPLNSGIRLSFELYPGGGADMVSLYFRMNLHLRQRKRHRKCQPLLGQTGRHWPVFEELKNTISHNFKWKFIHKH